MASKKKKERLTPIPRPRKRSGRAPGDSAVTADAQPTTAPDLSHIRAGLRSIAVPTASLAFHPKNPRRHSEDHIADIAASLKVNGQVKNIVASTRTDPPTVVCGNGTLRAALSLGWQMIACELLPLTEAQENQLAIIDNAVGAAPDWDAELLKEMMADVDTGCDERLDAMMAELAKQEKLFAESEPMPSQDVDNSGQEPANKIVCPACGHAWSTAEKNVAE